MAATPTGSPQPSRSKPDADQYLARAQQSLQQGKLGLAELYITRVTDMAPAKSPAYAQAVKLRAQLEQVPVSSTETLSAAVHTEYESWQADLVQDTFYTPRDLAESSNTELAGRLVL